MAERYYVGAYWGPRGESVNDCARRIVSLLKSLGGCDPILSMWFRKGRSQRAARAEAVETDVEYIATVLREGVSRRDLDGGVIQDLGYRLGLWNGRPDPEATSLSLSCGCANARLGNSAVIQLPPVSPTSERLFDASAIRCIVAALVRSLQPDLVNVNSDEHRRLSGGVEGESAVGWFLFLPIGLESLPKLAGVSVESLDGGVLLKTTEDRLSASNIRDVQRSQDVGARLIEAGLLGRSKQARGGAA